MDEQVSVSQDIAAPADTVWAMVSDLPRMGEWSPENEGARWLAGSSGPSLGARFRGRNRNGSRRWTTAGRVVGCEPGRLFSFRITAVGLPISEWRYEFEPYGAGCRVSETWTDLRGPITKVLGKPVSGVAERTEHNRRTMTETLRRLKEAAEAR